jgi:hypothetical protein
MATDLADDADPRHGLEGLGARRRPPTTVPAAVGRRSTSRPRHPQGRPVRPAAPRDVHRRVPRVHHGDRCAEARRRGARQPARADCVHARRARRRLERGTSRPVPVQLVRRGGDRHRRSDRHVGARRLRVRRSSSSPASACCSSCSSPRSSCRWRRRWSSTARRSIRSGGSTPTRASPCRSSPPRSACS